ncbi:MAG: hypothetical protein GX855_05390 [Firmicutes bacterium]|nr:hypothetical protein [Bacillota bacterium]
MTGSSTTLARHALEGRDSPTTHRNIMTAYYLYLALGENQPYIGFTHDPCLDSTLLGGMGCTRLFAASQPLPIDLAAVAAWHLWEKTGAYHPAASSSRLIGNPPTASRSRHSPPRLELPRLTFPANPRSLVEFLASSWTPRGERALRRPRGHRDQVQGARSWLRHIRRHFRRRGLGNWREIDFEEITIESRLAADIPSELLEEVGRLIEGRVLSYDEVRSLLEQRHVISPYPLRDLLQACALAGKLEIWPGVISPLEGYHICCRCGERQQLETIDCPLCGRSGCVICLACRSLGEIRSCRELYYGSLQENSNSRRVFPGLTPQLEFRLTRAQAEAAAEFKGYVATWLNDYLPKDPRQTTGTQQSGLTLPHLFRKMSHDATSCLIWAVCGAGKTEIAFEGLALAIAAGLKAVFAVPRRDVVLEVAKRAQAAFPELSVTALYGGAKHEPVGPLVVATTHQLIRFHSCFDLAILDEADAFPYAGSAMLHRALQRAVKPGGL